MPRYEPPHAPGGGYSPADEAYGAPADPWRESAGAPAGAPTGLPFGVGAPEPDPMWGTTGTATPDWASGPMRPPQRPSGVRRLVVVLVVTLLVCGAAAATGYLLVRDEPAATGAPSPDPVTPQQASPTQGTPLPRSSTDVRFVVVGQCVRNEGGNDDPKLTITACGPRTYQVLERFDGATTGKEDARSKCSAVPGYTDWYFFDSPLDVLDYVLCLKSR
jgi:hypothetical protein